MSRLRAQGLHAGFSGRRVLHDIHLDLPSGEVHAILGPSGCGKTTLLRCLAGLKAPESGRVLLDEQDITQTAPEARGIVLLHQENTLFPHLDVERNVAFGLRFRRFRRDERRERVRELLNLVGLPGKEKRRADELSGGERQRVALARALAVEPRILLFDEPLSHLDQPLRVALRAELRRILRRAHATAYYVTHDQEEAFAMADRLVLLNEGRVIDEGPPARVFDRPANPHAARLLGHRNIFPYHRVDRALAETALGRFSLPPDAPPEGVLLLRTDQLELRPGTGEPTFRIESVEYVGGRFLVHAKADDSDVWTEQARIDGLSAGSEARLDSSRAHPVFLPPEGAK